MNDSQILIARSIWLFNTDDLNPLGVALPPVYAALRERYHFLQYPSRPDDFTKTEISYKDGAFTGIGVNLFIYPDGLIADNRSSTDVSDAFLDDMLTWARDNFRFRYDPFLVKTKAYESQIAFHSDAVITQRLAPLEQFAKMLEDFGTDITSPPQEVVVIAFRNDKLPRPSFTFERRDNTPFSENRFFSRAGFGTTHHLHLIEEFERLVCP